MSTPADYAGRTYDVSAFAGVEAPGPVTLGQVFLGPDGGTIVAGIQKLTQRFLLEFLTIRGSLPLLPLLGTNFLAALESGQLRTDLDVRTAFAFAVGVAERNLRAAELATDPDDERFASATLGAVAISPGKLALSIALASRAGSSRAILLPISTLP